MAALEVATLDDWDINTDPTSIHKAMGIINVPNWDQEVGLNIAEFIFSGLTTVHPLCYQSIAEPIVEILFPSPIFMTIKFSVYHQEIRVNALNHDQTSIYYSDQRSHPVD